ncbi:MAG: choice-of-anchor D domain-containing protein [Planctomycetota bacterium]
MYRTLLAVLATLAICSSASAQDFAFAWRSPEQVVTETGANSVRVEFVASLTSSGIDQELGAQGWTLGATADGGSIVSATLEGTAGAPSDEGGLRRGGFTHTELTEGAENKGVVSAVVLAFDEPVTMPIDGTADMIRLSVETPAPDSGCSEVTLRFQDGLRGRGQPIPNEVAYQGFTLAPEMQSSSTSVCSFPDIDVDPLSVDFEDTLLGESKSFGVTVENIGNATLSSFSANLSGDSSSDFQIDAVPDIDTLAPGASISIDLSYSASELGEQTGTLVIRSDDADESEVRVALTGMGIPVPTPDIQVSREAIDFGQLFVGTDTEDPLLIENTGSADLRLDSLTIEGDAAAHFDLSERPEDGTVLGPGQDAAVVVRYAPLDAGESTANLVVRSNDEDEAEVQVALLGTAVPVPVPRIEVTPESIDFGTLIEGESGIDTFSVRNSGEAALNIASIELAKGAHEDFGLDAEYADLELAAGSSIDVGVTYRANEVGAVNGAVLIVSDDPEFPRITVSLAATGEALPDPLFRRPDANNDGRINLTDAVSVLLFLFRGGSQPPCLDAADSDDNGTVNLTDAVYILNWLFRSADPVPDPGPTTCGVDPTPDELERCEYRQVHCGA